MILDGGPITEALYGWHATALRLAVGLIPPPQPEYPGYDLWIVERTPQAIQATGGPAQHAFAAGRYPDGRTGFHVGPVCPHEPPYRPETWPAQRPVIHDIHRFVAEAGPDEVIPRLAGHDLMLRVVDGMLAITPTPGAQEPWVSVWQHNLADAIRSAKASGYAKAARAPLN